LRSEEAGLEWPAAAALELELFPPSPAMPTARRAVSDWSDFYRELRQESVTLTLMWPEYRAALPKGFQYNWLFGQYRAWAMTPGVRIVVASFGNVVV